MQSDIELAITGFGKNCVETLNDKIPRPYIVEDRFSTGYGLVVRNEALQDDEEINAKLVNFLTPLFPLAEAIRDCACVMRIAVFSSQVTTTTVFSFKCLEALMKFNANIEISVYPLDEDPKL